MGTQVEQLSPQVGRNDPCHCGSGKKYKKCCLTKDEEKEQLKRRLEITETVSDKYFSVKEYIGESGYPVISFDYFLLEILNMTGGILHVYQKMNTLEIKVILSKLYREGKSFYSKCLLCDHACLEEPMREISFKSLLDQGVKIEEFPMAIQKTVSVNFFYFEFVNIITESLSKELLNILPKQEAEDFVSTAYHSIFGFISDSCWGSCNNKCMKEHRKSAYCSFCSFGENNLPCPKKEEITYAEIKAKKEDMLH